MRNEFVIALLVVLAIAGYEAGFYVGNGGPPSNVHLTGMVQAFYVNRNGGYFPLIGFEVSSVQFSYSACDNFTTSRCSPEYSSPVTGGLYSLTVPNGHAYRIGFDNSPSFSNFTGGCYFLSLSFPLYSNVASMVYNISTMCYGPND